MVDAGKRLGGACLFEGCIPSKALLHVAHVMHEVERAREIGVDYGEPKISLEALRAWKDDRVIGKLARGLAGVALRRGVEVIGGRAVFESSRALRVEGDTPQKISFKHAIVATGSVPAVLPGLASGTAGVMDSTARARARRDPRASSSSIGGGYVGLELGTVYAALGSQVTLVEMTDGLLPGVDRDLVQPLARRIDKLFTAVHLRHAGDRGPRDGGARRGARSRARSTETLRPRPGRGRPARRRAPGLGLEHDARPDRRARRRSGSTSAAGPRIPRIYAVGDVTGEPMLAHRAMRQGKVAAEVIAGRAGRRSTTWRCPRSCSRIPRWHGAGSPSARPSEAGRPVKVARFSWAASGRAATLGRSDGLTKLIVDPESGRVLGVGSWVRARAS